MIAEYLRVNKNIYANEDAIIDKILHDYTKTRSQKRKMETSPSYDDTVANTPTSRKLRLNKQIEEKDCSDKDDEEELSDSSAKSLATLRKSKQMRKQQFGHRVKCYKRRNFIRKKLDIKKENRQRRDEQLQQKRDGRWLFTTLSQSTPQQNIAGDSQEEELSFDAISDIEGRYRVQAKEPSSSSSSASPEETPTEDSDDNGSIVLTPSAAKLVPRPTRFTDAKKKEQMRIDDTNDREMKNMLSLWKAQRRSRDLQEELEKELTQDEHDSNDDDDVTHQW